MLLSADAVCLHVFSWIKPCTNIFAVKLNLYADVAVLRSENTSDKKSIVYILSLKEGFFCGGIH